MESAQSTLHFLTVLATQGIYFALSSLAREAFQGDKEADPVGILLPGMEGRREGTGVGRTSCPGTYCLLIRSLSGEIDGEKENVQQSQW